MNKIALYNKGFRSTRSFTRWVNATIDPGGTRLMRILPHTIAHGKQNLTSRAGLTLVAHLIERLGLTELAGRRLPKPGVVFFQKTTPVAQVGGGNLGCMRHNERESRLSPKFAFSIFGFGYSAYPEDKDNELFYAFCLLVDGEAEKAFRRLYYLREYKNSVYAASLIARNPSTGGNFDGDYSTNRSEVNEAIQAHQDTLFMISAKPHYPYPDEPVYEYKHQFELYSNHDIPYLYFEKLNTVFLVYTIRFFYAPPATPVTGIWNSIPNTRLTPWKV